MNLTRRKFLQGIASTGVAVSMPAQLAAVLQEEPEWSWAQACYRERAWHDPVMDTTRVVHALDAFVMPKREAWATHKRFWVEAVDPCYCHHEAMAVLRHRMLEYLRHVNAVRCFWWKEEPCISLPWRVVPTEMPSKREPFVLPSYAEVER